VILFSVAMGIYLYAVDLSLNALIHWVYRTLGAA
jgi:preprotein translocase subunit SecE